MESLEHIRRAKRLYKTYDKNIMISYSEDKIIRIKDTKENSLKLVLKGHVGSINDDKVTKNKRYLISGNNDCTIKVRVCLKEILKIF